MNFKKIKSIILILAICITPLLATVIVVTLVNSTNNSEAVIPVNSNFSPSETVRLYWDASFRGDVDIVSQLIMKEPKSFSDGCESEVNEKGSLTNGNEVEPKPLITPIPKDELKDYIKHLPSYVKFLSLDEGVFYKYYDKDSDFFSTYGTSHIININKYPIRHLIFEDEFTFEDESRVNIFYNDPRLGKVLDSSIFLKKENSTWKIFLILNKANLYLFDNKDYGKRRSKCSTTESNP